ncbi:hypothetical protein N3930_42435, partial [Bacillus thuringiensis]|nr:hypothetical protein [Bacillus thuringiensis]
HSYFESDMGTFTCTSIFYDEVALEYIILLLLTLPNLTIKPNNNKLSLHIRKHFIITSINYQYSK